MTLTEDTSVGLADGPQLAARWATAGCSSLLESWPRIAEGLTRAALQTQDAVLSAGLHATYAGLRLDASQALAWADLADHAQSIGLDLWQVLVREGERMADVAATELRYRAVDLLAQLNEAEHQREQLEHERDQLRARAEHERDQLRARAELERGQRQRAERERDQERTLAKEERRARQRAERASARLERQLERARSASSAPRRRARRSTAAPPEPSKGPGQEK
ncbi:MAG TPA: hypothetical protein VFA49_14720 [Chloroflexota bacterium]|nr:hypothetical protein [Chloroflexota bacterium]